jgi:hypothetical protein
MLKLLGVVGSSNLVSEVLMKIKPSSQEPLVWTILIPPKGVENSDR